MSFVHLLAVVLTVLACTAAEISKKEKDCFTRKMFYHEPTDKCYELLEQGPCPDGEWWVLRKPLKSDKDVIFKAVCEKDPCGDSGLFWQGKECVTEDQKTQLCGNDPLVILTTNDFGEGECMCYKSPPHARLDDNPDNRCYKVHSKGPCNGTEIFAIPSNASVPKCILDPCADKGNLTWAMYNGTCYQLETPGPCREGMIFRITATRKPNCSAHSHSVTLRGCAVRADGTCVEVIEGPEEDEEDENWMQNLYDKIQEKKKKK